VAHLKDSSPVTSSMIRHLTQRRLRGSQPAGVV